MDVLGPTERQHATRTGRGGRVRALMRRKRLPEADQQSLGKFGAISRSEPASTAGKRRPMTTGRKRSQVLTRGGSPVHTGNRT